MRAWWVMVLVLAALGAQARPERVRPTADELEARALGRQILVARAFTALQLTDAQQRALKPIVATPDDAARVRTAWALLTTAQGARLRRVSAFGVEDEAAVAARLLDAMKPATDTLPRLYAQIGLQGEEINRAVKAGTPIFAAWQALPTEEAVAKRADYLDRLLALPEAGILAPAPDARTAQIIADSLLSPEALRRLDPAATPPAVSADNEAAWALARALPCERAAKALNLTSAQATRLLALLTAALPAYRDLDTRRAALATKALPTLRALRAGAEKGTAATPEQRTALAELEAQRAALQREEDRLDATNGAAVKALLTPKQLAALGADGATQERRLRDEILSPHLVPFLQVRAAP
jgi:hypothetical protein